jgi:sugar phosphate isomerase/epimerase
MALTPKKGIFAPLLYAGNLKEGVETAARLGFDGVELSLRDPSDLDEDYFARLMQQNGLDLVMVATGQAYLEDGLSFANTEVETWSAAVKRAKTHIDLASRFQAQLLIGGIRGRLSPDPARRRSEYRRAVDALRECARYAASKGVTLAVEPINRYETNFINTIEEALHWISDVGETGIMVMVDTFHMNIEEASFEDALRQAGERLSHVHLVDSNRRAPGSGHIDFRSVLQTLQDIDYQGYLCAEILPLPDDYAAAQQFVSNVKNLLASLER